MYSILAKIAEKQGRAAEAREWRRKEQESYAAYAGAGHEMRQYQPLIQAIVAACQGDAQARQQVEVFLPQMEASKDWQNLPSVTRRILAGERNADKLCAGIDRTDAYIVHAILAQLAGERPSPPGPLSRGTGEGETPTPTPSPLAGEGGRPTSPPLAGEGPGERSALAAILQQWAPVIRAVVAACRGNRDAAAQLQPLLGALAQRDDWRALSATLRRILNGERDPNTLLPGLDATDTFIVAAVLQTLGGPPGEAPS